VYGPWLDESDADVVFVRPDCHLYADGCGNDPTDLATGFLAGLGVLVPGPPRVTGSGDAGSRRHPSNWSYS
jgi:hypothetical protein